MTEPRQTLGRLHDSAFGALTLPEIPADIINGFLALPELTGMVSDALDLAGLFSRVVPGTLLKTGLPGSRVVGRAVTVKNRKRSDTPADAVAARDNRLGDIEAHNLAEPGDVVVVQGVDGVSSLGGIAMNIAKRQSEAAIVVDGAVRDIETSREIGLPVFFRGVTPVTGKWRVETVGVNVPVTICGVSVDPGDLVVADDTGVCFVPREVAGDVLALAARIAEDERRRQAMIADGRSLAELAARPKAPAEPRIEKKEAKSMLVEHRTYTLPHGRMNEYIERYEKYGLPVQERYLGNLYGFFISEIGPLNQVIFLWAYESLADRETRRTKLELDPDWVKFRDTNVGAFVAQETKVLRVAPFSPPFAPRTGD